jgi:hypothetical protein
MRHAKPIVLVLMLIAIGTPIFWVWWRSSGVDPFDRLCVSAGLEKKLAGVNVRGMTGREAIGAIERAAGVRIEPRWRSLKYAGFAADVKIDRAIAMDGMTVEQAVAELMGSAGGFDVVDGVIVLDLREELPRVLGTYAVADRVPRELFSQPWTLPPVQRGVQTLVNRRGGTTYPVTVVTEMVPQVRPTAAAPGPVMRPNGVVGPPRPNGAQVMMIPFYMPSFANAGEARVHEICTEIGSHFPSLSDSGTGDRFEELNGVLVAYQTRQRHRQIRKLLEEMRRGK